MERRFRVRGEMLICIQGERGMMCVDVDGMLDGETYGTEPQGDGGGSDPGSEEGTDPRAGPALPPTERGDAEKGIPYQDRG